MKLLFFGLAALAASASTIAQTAPAAPSLTAGAAFKGLQFDWDPVADASWYQLELRAHRTGAFVQQGDDLPSSVTSLTWTLPLHLFDWTYARYRLGACNSAGCTYSDEVSVSDLRTLAVGYFKALTNKTNSRFGNDTDLSPDGRNFVVAAPLDDSVINGTTYHTGSISVFRRKANGVWGQRARLVPTVPPHLEGLGDTRVAISADGDTVAYAQPNFAHVQNDENPGEVFVFHFDGTSKWIRTRIPRPEVGTFGDWVGINDAGNTLAVGVQYSNTTRVAIYRLVSGAWQNVRNIPRGGQDCRKGVLSRDGSTVAESCFIRVSSSSPTYTAVRVFSGPNWTTLTELPMTLPDASPGAYIGMQGIGIDSNGSTIAAQIYEDDVETTGGPSQVNVFKRGSSGYTQVAELKPGAWRDGNQKWRYGLAISVSGDGSTLVVGDVTDNGFGTGPRAAPLNPTTTPTGAAYVYRLKDSAWVLANMVKPNKPVAGELAFGRDVSLDGTGKTLILGQESENSNAHGIGGDWTNTDSPFSGAVWMY